MSSDHLSAPPERETGLQIAVARDIGAYKSHVTSGVSKNRGLHGKEGEKN